MNLYYLQSLMKAPGLLRQGKDPFSRAAWELRDSAVSQGPDPRESGGEKGLLLPQIHPAFMSLFIMSTKVFTQGL